MQIKLFNIFRPAENGGGSVSLIGDSVAAGFPSPAEGFLEEPLNLHDYIVKNPAATFFIRVIGDSMQEAGIASGDILVVDRSLMPKEGKIVVAIVDGEFTVKRIHFHEDHSISLIPANTAYPHLKISLESDFQIWGVVSYVIHKA